MNKDWSIDIINEGSIVRGADDIIQCFYIILHTIPGSDPLRPDFGSDIYQYLDKPVNQFSGKFCAQVKNDLEKWEPRVSIKSVGIIRADEHIDVKISGIYLYEYEPLEVTLTIKTEAIKGRSYSKSYNEAYS
ncbi:MAG: GPW/gp25 family protein [Prevotella sp.]|nr:GPW/gp25 family protein [Prevotella sp.]